MNVSTSHAFPVDTVQQCMDKCKTRSNYCSGFSYDVKEKTCNLNKKIGHVTAIDDYGFVSGAPFCNEEVAGKQK